MCHIMMLTKNMEVLRTQLPGSRNTIICLKAKEHILKANLSVVIEFSSMFISYFVLKI